MENFVLGVAVGTISGFLSRILYSAVVERRDKAVQSRNAYVFLDGQPMRNGHVFNSIGAKVLIDENGRFTVPHQWEDGSQLLFYNADGNWCGKARLKGNANGEFDIIYLVSKDNSGEKWN